MAGRTRQLLILLLVPLVLTLSSCVRLEADFEVTGADKVRVGIDVAVQTSTLEDADAPTASELCSAAGLTETDGLITAPYEEDGYSGCRQSGTMTIGDADISSPLALDNENIWRFSLGRGDVQLEEGNELWTADDFDDFRVTVRFPGGVLFHSGSSTVQGTTVTWTDAEDFTTGDGLRASAEHATDLGWLWGLIGVIALFVLGGIVYKVRNPKGRPHPKAPERRIVVHRGGKKFE